jgi:hypothetical protein
MSQPQQSDSDVPFPTILLNLLPECVTLDVHLVNDVSTAVPEPTTNLERLVDLGNQVQNRLQLIREPLDPRSGNNLE